MAAHDARVVALCAREKFPEQRSLEHVWVHPDVHGLGMGMGTALVRHALTYRTGDDLPDTFGATSGISIFFR